MARRRTYELVVHVSANDSDVALLHALELCAGGAGVPVRVSVGELARALGLGAATVRRSSSHLVSEGLMVVAEARRDDGGRDVNSYTLTTAGGALLHTPEARALVEAMRPIRVPNALRQADGAARPSGTSGA